MLPFLGGRPGTHQKHSDHKDHPKDAQSNRKGKKLTWSHMGVSKKRGHLVWTQDTGSLVQGPPNSSPNCWKLPHWLEGCIVPQLVGTKLTDLPRT